MGFRYRPSFSIGKNIRIGKTGISFRTGIPGLTFRSDFKKGTAAGGFSHDDGLPEPELPTVGWAVIRVILYLTFVPFVIMVFGMMNFYLGLSAAIAFAIFTYKPLTETHTFAYKMQSIYVNDRRFKTGQRYEGQRPVVDNENPVFYTPSQIRIRRVEGTLKLIISGGMALFMVLVYQNEKKPSQPLAEFQMKGIRYGTPVDSIRLVEGIKLDTTIGYSVDKGTYAGDKGRLDYEVEGGRVKSITFTDQDSTAFPRLSQRLFVKYGPAQDTVANKGSLVWRNDSTKITLKRFLGDVTIKLSATSVFD